MRFRMPEGYAFVPHSSTGTALSPPASALQTVMVAVQEGQAAPAMTSRLRHQLLDDLSAWHVRTVIIGPMGIGRRCAYSSRACSITPLCGAAGLTCGGMQLTW